MPRRLPASIPRSSAGSCFAWDGVGLGADGDVVGWRGACRPAGRHGGVSAACGRSSVTGGDRVGREPWRSAAALMWETGPRLHAGHRRRGDWCGRPGERAVGTARDVLGRPAVRRGSLAGPRHRHRELRRAGADDAGKCSQRAGRRPCRLPLSRGRDGVLRIDWEPLLAHAWRPDALAPAARAGIFHESLARAAVAQVGRACRRRRMSKPSGLPAACSRTGCWRERVIAAGQEQGIAGLPARDGSRQ